MNNVNTRKDKSRLILLHITIGGLITIHTWQILPHTTPGFSARHIIVFTINKITGFVVLCLA